MLDEEFNKRRAELVRELADRADPFTKRRLLDLVSRYEKNPAKTNPPPISIARPDSSRPAGEDKQAPSDSTLIKENIVRRSTLDVLEGVLAERITVRGHHEK
jgi:hypothetical protein